MLEIHEHDIALVVDQLMNNDVSDDQEMIEFLDMQTRIPYNTVKKIVENERNHFLCNPFETEDRIDWAHYGIKIYY